jgi:Cu/Ag efflux protein CusF
MMKPKLALLASFLLAALAFWGSIAVGQADEQRLPGGAVLDADVAIATVAAIDQQTRKVTLRDSSGKEWTFTAGPEVRNLAQVQRGDLVLVQYYEGFAVALGPKGSGIQERADTQSVSRAKPGEKPAGAITETVDAVGTVQAIDRKTRQVTIKGALATVQLKVADDVDLSQVNVGDQVDASYVESLAISVEPAPKVSGTVQMETKSVALGLGVEWGHGTLTMYDGTTHKFKLDGMSVSLAAGAAKAEISGEVYHLVVPQDLEGTYAAGVAGIALGSGGSEVVMKNSKGVVMRLKSKQQGVEFALGTEGVKISDVQ